ncbi:MAG: type II secretion system GspH family protein [Nitrospirota bacterium]|nr:type II secretion system GspH family protein [Nitrospirota bacterium]
MLRREGGFTLIEITLVLFILGLMAAVVFPRIPNVGGGNFKKEARTLSGFIGGLYAEATFSRRMHRLVIDLDSQRYWGEFAPDVEKRTDYQPLESSFLKPVRLPSGVRVVDVQEPSRGKRHDGRAFAHFHPLGRAELVLIHLEDSDGEELTLQVNPFSGGVKVLEGYVELQLG